MRAFSPKAFFGVKDPPKANPQGECKQEETVNKEEESKQIPEESPVVKEKQQIEPQQVKEENQLQEPIVESTKPQETQTTSAIYKDEVGELSVSRSIDKTEESIMEEEKPKNTDEIVVSCPESSQDKAATKKQVTKGVAKKSYRASQPSVEIAPIMPLPISKNESKQSKPRASQQPPADKTDPSKKKVRAKMYDEENMTDIPIIPTTNRWRYGEGVTPNRLKIYEWNVNGMRSVMTKNQLVTFLKTHTPDILCVSQTKMDKKAYEENPIRLQGYHGYWNFCKISSGYAGTAIFSKYLAKRMEEDMLDAQHAEHCKEGRLITLEFQKFILINIYVPTVGKHLDRLQYRQRFDASFRAHINRLRQTYEGKPIIIAGDLNVSYTELDTHRARDKELSPSFTPTQRHGFRQLMALGFTDVWREKHPAVRAYTWWYNMKGGKDNMKGPGLGRRIDYFLVPNEKMSWVVKCDILRYVKGADHAPVMLILDMNRKIQVEKTQDREREKIEEKVEHHSIQVDNQVKSMSFDSCEAPRPQQPQVSQ